MVSIDPYINETTRHADIILPPVSPLERDHYDLVFPMLAVRNTSKYTPAVLPPSDGLHDWQIMHRLQSRLEDLKWLATVRALKRWWRRVMGPKRLLAMALWVGQRSAKRSGRPSGFGIKQLERKTEGVDIGPLTTCLFERMPEDHDFVELAPQLLLEDIDRLKTSLNPDDAGENQLVLIGRRHLRSNNSYAIVPKWLAVSLAAR